MVYVVTYEVDGITGPGGFVSTVRQEVIEFATTMAEIGLDQLDDWVNTTEWFNLAGNEDAPRKLLKATDPDEVANVLEQIGEKLKVEDMGYIDLHEYHDLFEVVQAHDVESWCSAELKSRIAEARKSYLSVVRALADEWPAT